MTLEPQDVYLGLSMLAACVAIYGVSKWLYYGQRAHAIQREIDAMPPIDYTARRPRNPAVGLGSLPALKALDESRSPDGDGHAQLTSEPRIPGATGARSGVRWTGPDDLKPSPVHGEAGSVPADSHTNLVPFERGYAFTFSSRIH